MKDLKDLCRENIWNLAPYSCARTEFAGRNARVFLDANENITTPVLLKFAEQLLRAYAMEDTYEEVYPEHLFEEFSLFLIPRVNPDGVDLVNGLLEEGFFYRRALRIAQDFPEIPFPNGGKAKYHLSKKGLILPFYMQYLKPFLLKS